MRRRRQRRKLKPRYCRWCLRVFVPATALQRYGNDDCRRFAAEARKDGTFDAWRGRSGIAHGRIPDHL